MRILRRHRFLAAALAVTLAIAATIYVYLTVTAVDREIEALLQEAAREPPSRMQRVLVALGVSETPTPRHCDLIAKDLARIGLRVVPRLVWALEQGKGDQRVVAGAALMEFRPTPASAIPALVRGLEDEDIQVQSVCCLALSRAGPQAVPGLTNALSSSNVLTRRFALVALEQLGPDAKAAVQDLKRALHDEDEPSRRAAARILAQLGVKVEEMKRE